MASQRNTPVAALLNNNSTKIRERALRKEKLIKRTTILTDLRIDRDSSFLKVQVGGLERIAKAFLWEYF